MSFKFPFTNYHELNLTWVLEQLKKLFEESEENVQTIETYDDRLSAVESEVTTLDSTTSQAITTANAAATNAATALSRANTANENALTASSQAGAAVTAAQGAMSEAQAATQTAQQAQATAMTFDGRITQAENDASTAVQAAASFENRVNAAINTANNAANTATIAQGIAVNANQNAAEALDRAAAVESTAQTAESTANAAVADVDQLGTALEQHPSISWTVGRGISAEGAISNNQYTALSSLIPCTLGDLIVNNTPDKDANNKNVTLFVATYIGDTFNARTAISHGNSLSIPEGVTQFRLQFGRPSSTGVAFQQSDIDMLDIDYYLKWVTLQAYNAQINEIIKGYSPMITTAARLSSATGGSNSANDFPVNSIVCVGANNIGLLDYPAITVNGQGVYMTYQHINGASNGECQFCVCGNGHATRWKVGGIWTEWKSSSEEVYYVGGSSGNNRLTSLLIDLKDNKNPKTIFIYPGTYDIFAEYQYEVSQNRLSIPPDNVNISNYFYPYNAFIPNNTKLVGLGDVCLQMTPDASAITYGESRTWAPLNTLGAVEIENISIVAKNCRYCIHDDTHSNYYNTKHVYRNVRCVYTMSDVNADSQQLGLNSVTGFGFGDGCNFVFDSCDFKFIGNGNHGVFYGHGRSDEAKTTASILVKDCVFTATDATNQRVLFLQTISETVENKIDTRFTGCYLNPKTLDFNLNKALSVQSFEVVSVNSGTFTAVYSGNGRTNPDPYTLTVYNN